MTGASHILPPPDAPLPSPATTQAEADIEQWRKRLIEIDRGDAAATLAAELLDEVIRSRVQRTAEVRPALDWKPEESTATGCAFCEATDVPTTPDEDGTFACADCRLPATGGLPNMSPAEREIADRHGYSQRWDRFDAAQAGSQTPDPVIDGTAPSKNNGDNK